MNTIIQAMRDRRSCRRFTGEMPPTELVDEVVEAGLWAASGMGKQSPIIVKVTNEVVRNRLSEANRIIGGWGEGFDPFYGAPVILVVLAPSAWENRVYDGSLVMGNLMLAAHSLGLASIWVHRAREEFELPAWKELLTDLGIEDDWEGIGHCALGYASAGLPKGASRKANRVFDVDDLSHGEEGERA